MREFNQGDVVAKFGIKVVAIDGADLNGPGVAPRQLTQYVNVGVKVGSVGKDDVAFGTKVERGANQFRNRERQGVSDEHLTGPGTNQRRQSITESNWHVHPARCVPRTHQATRPLVIQDLANPSFRRNGHWTQRVAVQIDLTLGQEELGTQQSQRIAAVKFQAVFTRCHSTDLTSQSSG